MEHFIILIQVTNEIKTIFLIGNLQSFLPVELEEIVLIKNNRK